MVQFWLKFLFPRETIKTLKSNNLPVFWIFLTPLHISVMVLAYLLWFSSCFLSSLCFILNDFVLKLFIDEFDFPTLFHVSQGFWMCLDVWFSTCHSCVICVLSVWFLNFQCFFSFSFLQGVLYILRVIFFLVFLWFISPLLHFEPKPSTMLFS